ncbi:hypothetical protein QAD02_012195 [Eretmocerus hayati]|uniref:Uncharacterized protein n=1 Tax=Eretmocerus hayati TaxID=131215 RepID=A0ACC2NZY0_9HYME|nr:hypothetical protein QAD02_012195 [Eretmocerus hayati]
MWALVLWTSLEPPKSSIINSRNLRRKKTFAKASDGKVYPVRVVAEDNDKSYLNSLPVSTDGEIMRVTSNDDELSSRKRATAKEKRAATKSLNTVIETIDKGLTGHSIFENEVETDNEDVATVSSPVQTKKNERSQPKIQRDDSKKSSLNGCYFCTAYPEGESLTSIACLHLRNICTFFLADMVPLVLGSDVIINRYKLNDFKRFANGEPKPLIRSILGELIGEEKLAKMTASTIPKNIMEAVERFVNTCVSKKKILSPTEFKRCATLYCGSMKIKFERERGKNDETRAKESNQRTEQMSHSTPRKINVLEDEDQSEGLEDSPYQIEEENINKRSGRIAQKKISKYGETNDIDCLSSTIPRDPSQQYDSDDEASDRARNIHESKSDEEMINDSISSRFSEPLQVDSEKNEQKLSKNDRAQEHPPGPSDKDTSKGRPCCVTSPDSSVIQNEKMSGSVNRCDGKLDRVSEIDRRGAKEDNILNETRAGSSIDHKQKVRTHGNDSQTLSRERKESLNGKNRRDETRDMSDSNVAYESLTKGSKKKSLDHENPMHESYEEYKKIRQSSEKIDLIRSRSRSLDERHKKSAKRKHRSRSEKRRSKKSKRHRSYERYHHKSKKDRHRSRSRSSSRRRD